MSLDLRVLDESAPNWLFVHDVYTPKLLRFEPKISYVEDYIEHIDVVTTWKGLFPSQRAEELFFWEKAFRNALNSIVEEWLMERLKKKNIDLTLDENTLPLLQIHRMVYKLGVKSVPCKLPRLVDHMLWYHECSGLSHPWLLNRGDSRIAIENFIHLHNCFQLQGSKDIRVHFTSQISNDNLQIFGSILSKPHTLHLHSTSDGIGVNFETPCLENASPSYHVSVDCSPDNFRPNLYHCVVRTHFPDGIAFERVYRIRPHIAPRHCQPEWLAEARKTAEELIADLKREQSVKEKHPRAALREVSTNSVRVQGIGRTDLEREAQVSHPELWNAHQDVLVGKSAVYDEISGQKAPPTDLIVNITHTNNSARKASIYDEIFGRQNPQPADFIVNTARTEDSAGKSAIYEEIFGKQKPSQVDIFCNAARTEIISPAAFRSQAPSRLDSAYAFSPVDTNRLHFPTSTSTPRKRTRHSYDDESDNEDDLCLPRIARTRQQKRRISAPAFDSDKENEDISFVSPRGALQLAQIREKRDLELCFHRQMNRFVAENQKLRALVRELNASNSSDMHLNSAILYKERAHRRAISFSSSDSDARTRISDLVKDNKGKGKEKAADGLKHDSPLKEDPVPEPQPAIHIPDQDEIKRNYAEFLAKANRKGSRETALSRFSDSDSASCSVGYLSSDSKSAEEQLVDLGTFMCASPVSEPTAEISISTGV